MHEMKCKKHKLRKTMKEKRRKTKKRKEEGKRKTWGIAPVIWEECTRGHIPVSTAVA